VRAVLPKLHSALLSLARIVNFSSVAALRIGMAGARKPVEETYLGANLKISGPGTAPITPDLGVMRTVMAADRTLMAWIRTALSLLSFSFAIYKILQEIQEAGKILPHENSPRNVGIFLGILGTAGMVMGTIEYCCTLQELRQLQVMRMMLPPLIMAVLVSASGVALCVGIISRLL
jgi:putative membrane protein